MKRKLFFAGGVVAVGLGVAGIALPLLPTTPFLLLAAYLFARSSPAHYDRLVSHRVLGPYVRDWAEKRGLRRSAKVRALLLLWAVLLPTSCGLGHTSPAGMLLLATGTAVSVYILGLATLPERPPGPDGS
ncbi:MAG: DUF454 family protein [Thermoanaerobaculia bacterium]|nr:DUF454 family protein [Thermoanaerobaculia bacterium]